MDKFLQKVSHQDYMPTGARKQPKKSQKFRGGESGENYYLLYRSRQNFNITTNQFFRFCGLNMVCKMIGSREHYIMPGGSGFQNFISISKKL